MKWSAFDRVIAVWVCVIASCALIFVFSSLSGIIWENSSTVASWVQAIGSIAAILAGFYLSERTLRVQYEQQIQRDLEEKRYLRRMQYCVLADKFESAEALGITICKANGDYKLLHINHLIRLGHSVVNSLRSIPYDQLPSVESIKRVNMNILSADILVAACEELKNQKDEQAAAFMIGVSKHAKHLKRIAAVDKDFCRQEVNRLSTQEENIKTNESEVSRNAALVGLYDQ